MKLNKILEDMTGADQNRQQMQQSQNPRLLYSQQFMKAKQLAMGIAQQLDQHANQDRDVDLQGQVGDMGHVIEELNKIYNFLANK